MLLLYRSPADRIHDHLSEFTFHYASTLSNTDATAVRKITDLHSTMLLLYRPGWSDPWPSIWIYIPLCFYFILTAKDQRDIQQIHLHSTMLLLYPISSPPQPAGRSYLHSTMLLLYRTRPGRAWSERRIYIPLCFYFIAKQQATRIEDALFTFHYASTLSDQAEEE